MVVTEDNGPMYYIGSTAQDIKKRWQKSSYIGTSLWPYIERYGWKNIEHSVFAEGLDRETAYRLEDTLILLHRGFGCCINEKRSGLIAIDPVAYNKWLYENNPELLERKRRHQREKRANDPEYAERRRQENRVMLRNRYANDQEYAERKRQYARNKMSTPEGKIYDRVKKFNYAHPDRITESPLEARNNYIKYHIIPQYIKHDDL